VTSRRRRPPTARSGKSDFRRARPTPTTQSILRRTDDDRTPRTPTRRRRTPD
jgi:hypothetical protein